MKPAVMKSTSDIDLQQLACNASIVMLWLEEFANVSANPPVYAPKSLPNSFYRLPMQTSIHSNSAYPAACVSAADCCMVLADFE